MPTFEEIKDCLLKIAEKSLPNFVEKLKNAKTINEVEKIFEEMMKQADNATRSKLSACWNQYRPS